jgi:hypothetical protein
LLLLVNIAALRLKLFAPLLYNRIVDLKGEILDLLAKIDKVPALLQFVQVLY